MNKRKTIAISIPTGIGLEIGGYAGDFGYIARQFSNYFNVVVNPNAVNGGILSAINRNMLYVEGFAFDNFLKGAWSLKPVKVPNNIGVIFDCAIPKNILNIHLNTLNALKMTCGIDILGYETTLNKVGVSFSINRTTKVSSGQIKKPDELLKSVEKLIKKGANAIAVVCFFEDAILEDDINYSNAEGPDPIGGVEAVISHFLTKEFKLPTAHAPAFSNIEISEKLEHPKLASEFISSTYLPCVIKGLEYAPQISDDGLKASDLSAFVVPQNAMGSAAALGAYAQNIPIYAVKNSSCLNVSSHALKLDNVIECDNYTQALELLKQL